MLIGRPSPSQTVWSFEFSLPLVHPGRPEISPFRHASRSAVSSQVRRIDLDGLGFRPLACKPGEDAVEDTHKAPADEAVIR